MSEHETPQDSATKGGELPGTAGVKVINTGLANSEDRVKMPIRTPATNVKPRSEYFREGQNYKTASTPAKKKAPPKSE